MMSDMSEPPIQVDCFVWKILLKEVEMVVGRTYITTNGIFLISNRTLVLHMPRDWIFMNFYNLRYASLYCD
jgi:hypothetical protein